MKILVTCPHLDKLGGVANHYLGLKSYWSEDLKYIEIGNRGSKEGNGKYWIIWDILRFLFKVLLFRPNCLMLNPSIGNNALRRDFLFQRIAKICKISTIIFIHGFNLETFEKINKNWLVRNLNKANLIFVLAENFKKRLEYSGVKVPIELATTKVDDVLLQDFDINSRDGRTGDILFLARVDKAKGIHETLDTFKILKKSYPALKLNIVGDGPELPTIRDRIEQEKIVGVKISGRLVGSEISDAYQSAMLLILLSYSEGMPTTVLEAMAFGLPVITRPVGGLVDFFENGKMGVMDSTLDPEKVAYSIRPFLDNPNLTKEVAYYNHEYALSNFMASAVAKKMETTIKQYIK